MLNRLWKKASTIGLVSAIVLLTACEEKNLYNPNYRTQSPMSDLNIPRDFNWSVLKETTLTVEANDLYNGKYYYIIEIFEANPITNKDASLLSKGVAKKEQNYEASFYIPQALTTLYIKQTDPKGFSTIKSCGIEDSFLTFANSSAKQKKISPTKNNTSSISYPEELPTPINVVEISGSQSIQLPGQKFNDFVIRKDDVFTGTISYWGSGYRIYIEGEWEIPSDITLEAGLEIIIQNGGKLTFAQNSTIGINGKTNFYIMKGGELNPGKKEANIKNNNAGDIINRGTLYLDKLQINKGTLLNEGTIEMNEFKGAGLIENKGLIHIEDLNTQNYSLTIDNYCRMTLSKVNLSGASVFIRSGASITCKEFESSGANINMESNSLLEVTEKGYFNSYQSVINGIGEDYALAKFAKVELQKSGTPVIYKDKVEIECSDHTANTPYDQYYQIDGASMTEKSQLLLPGSECMGNGNIPDDVEPSDPVFPLPVPTSGIYTFMIEDNWPVYGDYDMNDLVLDLEFESTKRKDGYINSLIISTSLRAIGASKQIAAAIQLDGIDPKSIERVKDKGDKRGLDGNIFVMNENGTESEQKYAVIPFFEDAHVMVNAKGRNMVNTADYTERRPVRKLTVEVIFNNSANIKEEDLNIAKMNLFAVIDGKSNKRKEVHLPGYPPSEKVDKRLFGGNDDDSNRVFYLSKENLPWALLIPTHFKYSLESRNIRYAYPEFIKWATSGGQSNSDWYLPEKANQEHIYISK